MNRWIARNRLEQDRLYKTGSRSDEQKLSRMLSFEDYNDLLSYVETS